MSKIKNWTRISEGDINYDQKFDDSRFDREVKPIVWEFDGHQDLFYVVYKNPDGYYISEYVGMDGQDVLTQIPYVEDIRLVKNKGEAHSIASNILEINAFPFGDFDIPALKKRAKNIIADMYSVHYGVEKPDVRIHSLQSRSDTYARFRGGLPIDLWVDWEAYKNSSYEKRLRSLIHELSHEKKKHHKPSFWYNVFEIYHDVEGYMGGHFPREIDWEKVAELIVKDIHDGNLDMRTTTVGEMRKEAEKELGVSVDDRFPRSKSIKNLRNKVTLRYPEDNKWQKTEEVELPNLDPEMLWNWVTSNHNKVTVQGKEKYYVDIPNLSEDLEPVTQEDKMILGVLKHYNQSENPSIPYQKV